MAESKAASVAVMATAIQDAIKGKIDGYANQVPAIDADTQKKIDVLDESIDAFGTESKEGKRLAKMKASIMPDMKKLRARRLREVAEAVVIATNNMHLPLMLKKAGKASGSTGGGHNRMSSADMGKACSAVVKALPSKSGKYLPKGEIAKKAKLDGATVTAALGKLKRDGEAASNGMRGQAGGWRKA